MYKTKDVEKQIKISRDHAACVPAVPGCAMLIGFESISTRVIGALPFPAIPLLFFASIQTLVSMRVYSHIEFSSGGVPSP